MSRFFVLIIACSVAISGLAADPPPSQAERFLHDGRFADGETALLLALDANPSNDEARFGLGVIQFVRAVENLGKALHEYGMVSQDHHPLLFLGFPVPRNEKPSAISYKALGRVLDAFASDLGRAEGTLAGVRDDNVKLRLRLSNVAFDFTGNGKDRKALLKPLTSLNAARYDSPEPNPDFRVHFDRGDVAWLRAYCHLLCAMVEGYRAVDDEAGFEQRVSRIFPNVEASTKEPEEARGQELKLVDSPRLRRMRQHLVMVCELTRETWTHIRKETDDDYEWLPHPKQSGQRGVAPTHDDWLSVLAQWEVVLKGERLIPVAWFYFMSAMPEHLHGKGLNLKKVLDDPPDLFNWKRIKAEGIDAKYLEADQQDSSLDVFAMINVNQMLMQPFGFAYAARSH